MLNILNNLLAMALMPLTGDNTSPWPYILIGVAVVLIVVLLIVNRKKNK